MQLAGWSQQLLRTQQQAGHNGFYAELSHLLGLLLPFDDCVVLQFSQHGEPNLLHQHVKLPGDNLSRYLHSAYKLDPFYRKGCEHQRGLFRLAEICPQFEAQYEQYYNSYFRHLKISDEIGLLLSVPTPHCFIHVELARLAGNELFQRSQLDQLSAMTPVLEQLMWQHHATLLRRGQDHNSVNSDVAEFCRLFGAEICTPREYEVLALMIKGHCVKMIANHLQLGLETVKMHRKHLYAKLGVRSHPEVLALLVRMLHNSSTPVLRDPLLSEKLNQRRKHA